MLLSVTLSPYIVVWHCSLDTMFNNNRNNNLCLLQLQSICYNYNYRTNKQSRRTALIQ